MGLNERVYSGTWRIPTPLRIMSPDMNKPMPNNAVASPCIKVCRVHEDVCVGCGRSLWEIANWGRFTDEEKRAAIARAADRLPTSGSSPEP